MIVIQETSPETQNYNCIAWAVEDNTKRWEPDAWGIYFWPDNVMRKYSVEACIDAYKSRGYEICDNENLEPGYQKVAIYADNYGTLKHASRQLSSGKWTSKLGDSIDGEHEFVHTWNKVLLKMIPTNFSSYGVIAAIMKKPLN